MSDSFEPARDALLTLVDDAFEHDLEPVPAHLVAAAQDAFSWRLVDAELAELLFDSANDELIGVRGTSTERRSFRYVSGDVVIRVHLSAHSLIVTVEPAIEVLCRIVTESATEELHTDEFGELAVDAPDLPIRIELVLPRGKVVTPWITG